MKKIYTTAVLIVSYMTLAACASTQHSAADGPYDPLEGMNRKTYAFNKAVDQTLYRPVAAGYKAIMPKPAEDGVSNAMRNLREPWVFVNDILQLKFGRAGKTLSRFVINSTLGIGGLFKVSDDMGIAHHSEDFGQTLAVWGWEDSPYFIIPFVGPSSAADFTGFATSFFADPVTIGIGKLDEKGMNLARTGIDALDARVRLHEATNSTYEDPDGYVLMRSAYLQNRRFQIYDGNPPSADDDIFDDLEDEDFPE